MKLFQQLVKYFLAGAFAVLPLVITFVVVAWAVGFLNSLVGPNTWMGELLSGVGLRFVHDSKVAYLIGWGLVLVGLFLLGFFVESGLRRIYSRVTESLFHRLPLIGKVYDASKQIVDMLDKQDDDKLRGMSVVYCTFGEKGGAGVLALLPTPGTIALGNRQYHIVLVPQSPVPIGGGLLFVPVESVEQIPMSVDAFMGVYVSMGVTVPKLMQGMDDRQET